MSERNANYWIMQCGEHLLQIHTKERTRKELESQNYTSMIILSDFFFRSMDRKPPTSHENRLTVM